MSFTDHINAIPYDATIPDRATGILAPIMRTTGHILYLYGALAEPGYVLNEEEAHRELEHAADHLRATDSYISEAPISTRAKDILTNFINATRVASEEWDNWPETDRGPRLRDLANRAAAIGSFLDGELAGIEGAHPGSSL